MCSKLLTVPSVPISPNLHFHFLMFFFCTSKKEEKEDLFYLSDVVVTLVYHFILFKLILLCLNCPKIENPPSCGHKLHLCCWLTLLTEDAGPQMEPTVFSSPTYSKYTIELWPSSSLMRASRVFALQNKNWRWNSAPTTMTRESNKTGVLSCHGDSFLAHGRVSFMERIQVERECRRGVNLGKMSFSRTFSRTSFTCSAPVVAASAPQL